MKRAELLFPRPTGLEAAAPPKQLGLERDQVRLMISGPNGHVHARFRDLPRFLEPGDLLVVNRSATLPASLPASGAEGPFLLNLSTHYGQGLWLAEPRRSPSVPGPISLPPGEPLNVADLEARPVAPYPGIPRLWFFQIGGDVTGAMARYGRPIRYGYIEEAPALDAYQTLFASAPGSAEMPSAGRPFTRQVIDELDGRGVGIAELTLHTGVSSLEVEVDEVETHPLYPEPFEVTGATAQAVNAARREGRRVIAVGTTVARALESAWDGTELRASRGFTRLYIHPQRGVHTFDGLLTGLHDPVTSHLALLYAVAGAERIRSAYHEAVREEYLWHEFGDSHLIWRD